MRRCALALLLLALGARADDLWEFEFGNGDRIHGHLRAVRGGTVFLRMEAAPGQAVAVRLRDVVLAKRAEEDPLARAARQILRLHDGSLMTGRFRGIEKGKLRFAVDSFGVVSVVGSEIDELLPTAAVVDAYCRTVTPREAAKRLPEWKFEVLWAWLGKRDPNVAWRARRQLARAGAFALPWLDARLRDQPDAPGRIRRLVNTLDATSGTLRAEAQLRLLALGRTAEPVLRGALGHESSPETRRRLSAVLRAIDVSTDVSTPVEVLRVLRAVRVLEEIDAPGARRILDRLARGAEGAETTRAAREALGRLVMQGRG